MVIYTAILQSLQKRHYEPIYKFSKVVKQEIKHKSQLYSWPLNMRVKGTDPLQSQKSVYNVGLPENLTTSGLLLTKSLTDNIAN